MANHARWAWLLTLGVGAAAALANCSKDEEPPAGGTGKKTSKAVCKSPKTMTVTDIQATPLPGVLRAKGKGSDGKEFTLQIELSETPEYRQKPGSYDLSEQQSNYDGCRHCVVAFEGEELVGAPKQFFQTTGTLKLDTISSPPTGVSKGELSKVELRQVKIDAETAEITEVSNGACYSITRFEWDTTPPPNKQCQKAEDCGDPSSVACDPATGTCVAFQCEIETNKGCTEQQLCLAQEIGASYGACHARCTPFYPPEGCPGGLECVPLDGNQSQGKCVKPGPAAAGASCELNAVSTGCQPGLVCIGPEGGRTCQKACDFFDDTVACDAGQQCVYGGFCTAAAGDTAAIGAACAGGIGEGTPCGSDGATYRGVCVFNGSGLSCQRACRVGSVYEDCSEAGLVCAMGDGEAALPTCQPPQPDQEEQ